jgi:hypothetical protein
MFGYYKVWFNQNCVFFLCKFAPRISHYYFFVFLNSYAALSQWCIFHRKRARRVVDTWEKQFNSATKDKKVSFLYLSNDILQNSKRKGGDFVNEFWRVLPRSLKYVYENGGEDGKKVVARLVSFTFFHCNVINSLQATSSFCSRVVLESSPRMQKDVCTVMKLKYNWINDRHWFSC